jgi:hypothetical protein
LTAGPLALQLNGPAVNHVTAGGFEVLRAIYVSVRDQNWDTVQPRLLECSIRRGTSSFAVQLDVEHASADIDFHWTGKIVADRGKLRVAFDGLVRRDFSANRIGLCLLHSVTLAGRTIVADTVVGRQIGQFPGAVAARQPFKGIRGFDGDWPEVHWHIELEGDTFEMEDQRNWSDASYKTYSPPLEQVIPVSYHAGDHIKQSATLSLLSVRHMRRRRERHEVDVVVAPVEQLPWPAVGLSLTESNQPLTRQEVGALRQLKLAHLRVVVDMRSPVWRERLAVALVDVAALGVPVELEVVAEVGAPFDKLARELAAVDLARVLAFSGSQHVTTKPILEALSGAFGAAGIRTQVGGGSRAHFAEFNRASLPLSEMQVAGYPVTPQLHVFDNESLVETLGTQAVIVEAARRIVGDMPIAVGPVTLLPRYNSTAQDPDSTWSIRSGSVDAVDLRQGSLLVAGWTIGSLAALAGAGASSVTYFETTGWRGVMQRTGFDLSGGPFPTSPGLPFPVWHLLSRLAQFSTSRMIPVQLTDPVRVRALARTSDGRIALHVANLGTRTTALRVAVPPLVDPVLSILDATSLGRGLGGWRREGQLTRRPWMDGLELCEVVLSPCAIAEISGMYVTESGLGRVGRTPDVMDLTRRRKS